MANLVAFDALSGVPRRPYDAARLLRELETQFRLSNDPRERAILADWIVPEYISYGNAARAAEILDAVPNSNEPEVAARMATLRAEVHAIEGKDPQPDLAIAFGLLHALEPRAVALIHHRAGVAHYLGRQPRLAEEHSLKALWLADVDGLRRLASRTASVLYAVHYHLTGDLRAAKYYTEVGTIEAAAAGDAMARRQFFIMQLDLAVTFAEWDRARSLLELLRRDRWYDTYSAGTAAQYSVILLHGHDGDFSAMRGAADALLEGSEQNADYAFAQGLRALSLAALGVDDEAGKSARRALGLSREQGATELVSLTTRRRVAAVLAAFVCVLVGDVHRGTRALETRAKWPGGVGAFARALVRTLRGERIDASDPNLQTMRGLTELANTIRRVRLDRIERIPERVRRLTETELTLLRATATGKTNAEIARERGVTRNAVERRLMNAYEKLGVRNRTEAIAKLAEI